MCVTTLAVFLVKAWEAAKMSLLWREFYHGIVFWNKLAHGMYAWQRDAGKVDEAMDGNLQLCGIIQPIDWSIRSLKMLAVANQDLRIWAIENWSWGKCWSRFRKQRLSTFQCSLIGGPSLWFNIVQVDDITSKFYMGHLWMKFKLNVNMGCDMSLKWSHVR